MATTKTLTPTNQAITLAAFTEKPDNRTNVTNDDKLADAVNALNSDLTPTYDALTLESGITGTLRILRMGKLRSIYGNVRPSSSGTEIVVCTLASTDTPPINLITSYSGYGANATGEVNVYSDGRLVITANSAPANGLKFSVTYAVN